MSTAHWQGRRLPIPAAWPVRSSPAVHPWAIISAGLAPVLLTGAYLIAGIFQPASYNPVRKSISVMAGQAGTDRWIMTGGLFLAARLLSRHRCGPDRAYHAHQGPPRSRELRLSGHRRSASGR